MCKCMCVSVRVSSRFFTRQNQTPITWHGPQLTWVQPGPWSASPLCTHTHTHTHTHTQTQRHTHTPTDITCVHTHTNSTRPLSVWLYRAHAESIRGDSYLQ